jgi:hypothetical protein
MALAQWPQDHGLRFLFALNLAKVGLRTLAGEQLVLLPESARAHPDVASLVGALSGLPSDRITPDELRRVLAANLAALHPDAALTVRPHVDAWEQSLSAVEFFKGLDGTVIRREARDQTPTRWSGLFDQASLVQGATARLAADQFASPVVVEGLFPPRLALDTWRSTRRDALGHAPRLSLVQGDVREFLDGLALADLTEMLRDPRVECFVGPDAASRLEDVLRSRAADKLPDVLLASPAVRTSLKPWLQDSLSRVLAEQGAEAEALRTRIETVYGRRDGSWWSQRWRSAASGGPPLRVLIPTSRFTTFVQHSAHDLARAFERRGCDVRVLMEPDDSSRLSAVAYLRQFAELEPDLVVLINYPRSAFQNSIPPCVPFVCWVQDAMPHLFDKGVGAAQGPLDFVLGHTFQELFETWAYPVSRALPASVVADAEKFHAGPVAPSRRDHHACEIAFVSHHSEDPDVMHQRLKKDAAQAPAIASAFDLIYPDLRAAITGGVTYPAQRRIGESVTARLREVLGREPEARTVSLVTRTYAIPVADRLIRHEMVAWAADLAEERGWRLHLYGRGWNAHPRFGRFSKGEVSHDDDLRACYASAAVHLHASITTLVHQRVVECALSGGLAASRFHRDAIAGPKTTAQLALLDIEPDARDSSRGLVGYTVADHAETMRIASLLGRLGVPLEEPVLWLSEKRLANLRRFRQVLGPEQDADWLYGDLAEVTFTDRASLGAIVERAIASPSWRSAVVRMIASRARQRLTHDALAERLVSFIASELAAQSLAREAA